MTNIPRRLAVLASGGGSNLQAILDYLEGLGPAAPAEVVLVASSRAGAGALERARVRGIPAQLIVSPDDGAALLALLDRHAVSLIALAGYFRLIPPAVTSWWRGAILNIHPALLPRFGGTGMYGQAVHRAVLAAGDHESGATVHFVNDRYDDGAAIARARLPVTRGESAAQLGSRVLAAEHALYPRALHAVAAGWIALDGDGRAVVADRSALTAGIRPSAVNIEYLAAPSLAGRD